MWRVKFSKKDTAGLNSERYYERSAAFKNKNGISKGSRTPVDGMRTRCPRPLDDGDASLVCPKYTPGFEKSQIIIAKFLKKSQVDGILYTGNYVHL